MLHTMQLFFMRSRCSLVTTFLFPAGRAEMNPRQWEYKPSHFSFPALKESQLGVTSFSWLITEKQMLSAASAPTRGQESPKTL